jgi:hypothetical protein
VRTSLGIVATIVAGVIAVAAWRSTSSATPTRATGDRPQVIHRAARPATAMIVHRARMIEQPVEPALAIDEPRFIEHVEAIGKLVGHPASELAERLGDVAKVGDDFIEWNVADLGIAAGNAYALATIEGGHVTGVLFRGRSSEDTLHRLKAQLSLQVTMAGGERPSFSIVAGE